MSIIEKTLRWVVIVGVFCLAAVAIVKADTLFFPYITGKNFAFRIFVEIITGAWLALALVVPAYRPRRSWILGCFTIFVFVIAIANAQGVYPFKSFWSNYERMDGWITIAHTLLFLVVSASVLNTENLWRRFFQWSLVVSAFLSLLGLLQVAGILSLGSGGTGLAGRVDATFGNPIYFAAYMLFHVFIAALLWYQMWVVRGQGRRLAPSIMYGFIIGMDTITLLFSGTRGATLGLIGGGLLALLIFAFTSGASKRMRQVTAGVFITMALMAGALVLAKDTAFVQKVGFLNRLSSLSLSDDTTNARLLNMGMAWQGVKERPIFGWGQENYAVVFDKYYDPRMYAQEQWFDRVHNIIFDWWIAGGTLGLIAYFSIFAAALWVLWRRGNFAPAESSILTGLLAGYFVHNMTVFDNVTSYILFAMILGYMVHRENLAQKLRVAFETEILPRATFPVVGVVAVIVVWGSAWVINANAYAANKAIIASISPQGDIAKNLSLFKQAIAYGSYGSQEAREQLASMTMQNVLGAKIPDSLKMEFVQASFSELDLQAKASPLDARFPLFKGAVADAAGDYKTATVALAKAHELSPKKQTILYQMAQNAQAQGDTASMTKYFKEAFDLEPKNVDARLYYAAALIRGGGNADAILAPIISTGEAADPRITGAYASREEYSKLLPIWEARVKAAPTEVQGYFTLAAVHYAAKDSAGAIAVLKKVQAVVPSVKAQADQYIQQIENGIPLGGK